MHIGSGIYSLAEFSAPTLFTNANSLSERIQRILRGFIFYRAFSPLTSTKMLKKCLSVHSERQQSYKAYPPLIIAASLLYLLTISAITLPPLSVILPVTSTDILPPVVLCVGVAV